MAQKGNTKHVFPGANTSEGFCSYYDYILSQNDASRIFILKGGPGVGKSTFIKKIGDELLEKGYEIEYMHSSYDNNTLDGVVIPNIKIALIDGTLPHIVEPKNVGCVDEIINLGDYWNEIAISVYREQIKETNLEIQRTYDRSYKYLKAAKLIYDDIRAIYEQSTDFGEVNVLTDKLINNIFSGLQTINTVGKKRHLFASAITPNGLKNFIDSIINNVENIYVIKGEPGTGKTTLLTKIINYSVSHGLNVEIFHCAFDPDKIEHILIPQLSTVVVTSNEYHNVYNKATVEEIVDLNEFVNKNEILRYQSQLNYDSKVYNELLNQAITTINNAKRLHDLLETYYVPNINFELVEQKRKEIMKRILKYASNTN